MGDIVSLVEKAAEIDRPGEGRGASREDAQGQFDLEDLRDQLAQMEKIGGIGGMLGMLPGIGKMKAQIENANLDDRVIKRQRAIIDSMTPAERRNPDVLKASRKKRIAAGSGTKVEDVNKLLKMHRQMADVMKMMGGGKGGGIAGALGNMFGLGGGAACPSRRRSRSRRCRSRWAASCRTSRAARGGLPPLPPGLSAARAVPPCRASAAPSCRAFRASASRSEARRSEFSVPAAARAAAAAYPSSIARTELKGVIDVP